MQQRTIDGFKDHHRPGSRHFARGTHVGRCDTVLIGGIDERDDLLDRPRFLAHVGHVGRHHTSPDQTDFVQSTLLCRKQTVRGTLGGTSMRRIRVQLGVLLE